MRPRKLLDRLASGHYRNVAYTDFCRLVEAFGFRRERTTGSHEAYIHPEVSEVLSLQPRRGEAKPYQIRQFLSLVESYNLRLEDRS